MRTRLELPVDPLTLPEAELPNCSAICPDSPVTWEHPCPYRARWMRDGIPLCGHHVARRQIIVVIPDEAESNILPWRQKRA